MGISDRPNFFPSQAPCCRCTLQACKLSAQSRQAAAAAAASTAAAPQVALPLPLVAAPAQAQQALQFVGSLLRPRGWLPHERGWAEKGVQGLLVGRAAAVAAAGLVKLTSALPRRAEC
jgi:hypothetical protein